MSTADAFAAVLLAAGIIGAAAGLRWTGALAMSFAVTVAYRGPAPWALISLLVEVPLLAAVATRAVRSDPARQAVRSVLLAAVAILVLPLRFSWADVPDPLPPLGAMVIGVGLLVLAAVPVGWALQLRLQDRRRRFAVAEARSEQRLTLARGLHDLLAHEITGVVLEAQAAQLGGAADPEPLRRIEAAGQRALASMDDLIAQLADRPTAVAHGLAEVESLAARFTTTGGAVAAVEIAPDLADGVDAPTQALVYRAVLEALTNVRRHASDARLVSITVARTTDGTLVATVVNDGGAVRADAGSPAAQRRGAAGGTGLAALRADVGAAGGTLAAGPDARGRWRVIVRVPAAGAS